MTETNKTMLVCNRCLQGIESREGSIWKKRLDWDDSRISDDDTCVCEWCEDEVDSADIWEIQEE